MFSPDTLAEDGEPLDTLALVTEPTFPECRMPNAGFRMPDSECRSPDAGFRFVPSTCKERVFGVGNLQLRRRPHQLLMKLDHFFSVCKGLEDKKTAVLGWRPLAQASKIIDQAGERGS